MSSSFTASLICGFKLEIRNKEIERRKFDENTGEPYNINVFSHEIAFIDGIEIATSGNNVDIFCNGESIEGLEVGEAGRVSGVKWLGERVGSVNSFRTYFQEFNIEIPELVQKFADKHGVTPRWFLSLD